MSEDRQIHLVANLSLIHTLAMWRYPGSWNGYGDYGSPDLYLDLARLLEHGMFDAGFFADVAGTPLFHGSIDSTVEWGVDDFPMDPRRGVHETIQEIKEKNVGPNWGYLEEALRVTDDKTTIGEYARNQRGKPAFFTGTPEQIADQMEEAHDAGGANGGFILMPTMGVPSGFSRFVHEVVPVLQHRGLVRKEYTGKTMRENMKGA
jgi:alkanesulfonate monooxygenase SsuD/methylene tetrahydromethanopterin reductase-like flavin-dependent oxidoreductase (luciferase family)